MNSLPIARLTPDLRVVGPICYDATRARCEMKAILLIILSSTVTWAGECDREVLSKFLDPVAVERRADYVRRYIASGFIDPQSRVWENGISDRHPFWISNDPDESMVVKAYAEARHFEFEHLALVVSDNTNFFSLLLEINSLCERSEGVTLWLSVVPGSKLESVDAYLFIDSISRWMLRGKLIVVIEERSNTAFDNALPAHFIQPAA